MPPGRRSAPSWRSDSEGSTDRSGSSVNSNRSKDLSWFAKHCNPLPLFRCRSRRLAAAVVGQNGWCERSPPGRLGAGRDLAGAAVDTGAAIYAEYQLARQRRSAARLPFDPWVAILGFRSSRRRCVIATTNWRSRPTVESTRWWVTSHLSRPCTTSASTQALLAMRPDAELPVAIAGEPDHHRPLRHLGATRHEDRRVQVAGPPSDTDVRPAAPPSPASPETRDWSFSGTPTKAMGLEAGQCDRRPETFTGPDQTTLVLADRRRHRAQHCRPTVPDDKREGRARRLQIRCRARSCPGLRRPPRVPAVRPIIEGIVEDVTVRLDGSGDERADHHKLAAIAPAGCRRHRRKVHAQLALAVHTHDP